MVETTDGFKKLSLKEIITLNTIRLTDVQIQILTDIAINGPIDAYREHKRASLNLSTTQNTIKKLTGFGMLEVKEIVRGDTDQNRKIYCLTALGLCTAVIHLLNRIWSRHNYDDFYKFIKQNQELFPSFLGRWDFLIESTRKCYDPNQFGTRWHVTYFIPIPDNLTEFWCMKLYRLCDGCIGRGWHEITPEKLHQGFISDLVDLLSNDYNLPHKVSTCIIKQDPLLWDEVKPGLKKQLEFYKEQVAQLSRILKNE